MLHLADLDIDAISTAGLGTCIQFPSLDFCFDMGVCPQSSVRLRTVLFTHAHIDHMGAVVQHCATRKMLGMKRARYVVPPEHVEAFHGVLEAWKRLDRNRLDCEVLTVGVGETVALRSGHYARAFRSPHTMPAQGYVVFRQNRKLKPEWVGVPGPEIAAARRKGIEVTSREDVPLVAFTGDSTADVIDREPDLRRARLLVMELTFVDDALSVADARKRGHVHLDDIVGRMDQLENEHILFTHLSARYSHAEAQDKLMAKLPDAWHDRVTLLPHRLP
jgi:ribonuclease Z